jgi:hypothetical protein
VNRQDDLLENDEIVVEDQPVDGGRDRTLQRVFEGHQALIDRGVGDGAQEIL